MRMPMAILSLDTNGRWHASSCSIMRYTAGEIPEAVASEWRAGKCDGDWGMALTLRGHPYGSADDRPPAVQRSCFSSAAYRRLRSPAGVAVGNGLWTASSQS